MPYVDSLVNMFPCVTGIEEFLRNFALSTVSTEKVSKMLCKIDRSKATGLEYLPAVFVYDAAE